MSGKLLADMISRVLWSIDPTDTSTVKGVVRLATYEGEIHAVGANSSGVALRREPAPEEAQIGVSLTPKTAGHIVRWLSDVADDVHVASSAGKIRITHGGAVYTSKLFDAVRYFAYEGKIVETHENLARVDQDALSTALRRVMIMSDSKIGTLRLTFAPGELTVSARNDASGDGVEVFVIDYEGPEATVLIKGSQLAAIIAALQGDIMEFGFSAKAGEGIDGLFVFF